jgi:MEKHLA domain
MDPPWLEYGWVEHTQVLLDSFRRWVGRELIPRVGTPREQARTLFLAPFVVVSHGTQSDPVLSYGNRAALDLWEMDIETLLRTPSRLTAEPLHRDERSRLLQRTSRDGFVDDYSGIRISSSGRRFSIDRAIVWNLVDAAGERVGQAATFDDWKFLQVQELLP